MSDSSVRAKRAPSTPLTPSKVTVFACAKTAFVCNKTNAIMNDLARALVNDIEPSLDIGAVARAQELKVAVSEVEVVDLGFELERAMHPRQAPAQLGTDD